MTAPARLLALRLHGFKSFAERTTVEFGPGISAVVGPNGSGKSNLADALRWTLGEQGRSLRTRKAEDVIWAGSERRGAQGMADVSLLLDNADGLLPVDFAVVELGRRLYRSGENDYLLNRQRVRLKDLVDLLDAAHLADNAFLFIGQGMVDQALALRPEERRPLFEEVAGVRRHERRKRRSEDQLTESLANLARLEDILAELRPQARRLAAQAEQQASRISAGDELAEGLLRSAHARWFDAAARVSVASTLRTRTRLEADRAMADLAAAEDRVAAMTAQLAVRATEERERRGAFEAAGVARTTLTVRQERLAAEAEALARDRVRLGDERGVVVVDLEAQRRVLSSPVPPRDLDLEAALTEAERFLAEAVGELATLRAADRARGEELHALRRAEAARTAEIETARRRLAEAEARAGAEAAGEAAAADRVPQLESRAAAAREALSAAAADERRAAEARESARGSAESAEAGRTTALDAAQTRSGALAARRGRLEALRGRLQEEETRGIARAAKRRGGRRLDEDLLVEPALRQAVQAALSDSARAYLVPRASVGELGGERGMLMVGDAGPAAIAKSVQGAEVRLRESVAARGGGVLDQAIRRDAVGGATRLLARAAWLPSLADCVEIQGDLLPGWVAVPRDGGAVVSDLVILLGAADGTLERRAEVEALAAEVGRLEGEEAAAKDAASAASGSAAAARQALEVARAAESAASGARRRCEEADRAAARDLEVVARELGWHRSQAERLRAEVERSRDALALLGAPRPGDGRAEPAASGADPSAVSTWEQRATDIRARRDRLAQQSAAVDLTRREAEARRTRAEATIMVRDERLAALDAEVIRLGERERDLDGLRDSLGREAAEAVAREAAARAALDQGLATDHVGREQLATAERGVAAIRDRLRAMEEQARAAERAGLEADLGLDALREQLLVDLAAIGEVALRRLPAVPPGPPPATLVDQESLTGGGFPVPSADVVVRVPAVGEPVSDDGATPDDERARLERGLLAAAQRWAAEPAPEDAPSSARLSALRRRFSDLGAGNPYAVEEYQALKARLDDLDSQRADLGTAIARTRQLIEELSTLIADQFRTTFRALETAFDQKFQQLFGGGFAKLELTDPSDLGSTGIEITARPPGKKKQPLGMLSGGERSLTAVALLLAMLQVRPVPFCVLDEVDAALDEANVGRFTDALRELTSTTQFIVITHNRGTIRAADALYGVTVGDDSVSRVISLRLDEARTLAERQSATATQPIDNAAS